MHQKFAKDGLVALSVQLDSLDEKDLKDRVAKILKSKNVTFPAYILDEEPEFWQGKLRFASYPAIFVFDREGKWTQFKDEFKYEDVDRLVESLLKK